MLESNLRHKQTEIKNVKVGKMVEFMKTCDRYPPKFNFGHFFQLRSSTHFDGRKLDFQKIFRFSPSAWRGDDKNLRKIFAWGHE